MTQSSFHHDVNADLDKGMKAVLVQCSREWNNDGIRLITESAEQGLLCYSLVCATKMHTSLPHLRLLHQGEHEKREWGQRKEVKR